MIHLVLKPVEFTLCEVGKAGDTLHNETVGDGSDGVHVHVSCHLILPARLDVRLDQVLVETVPQGSYRRMAYREGSNWTRY